MAAEDVAKRMIKKKGRKISIRSTVETLTDTAKPWGGGTDVVTDTPTFGVFLDENSRDLEARVSAVSRVVLSPVETTGILVYIAAKGLSVVPTTAMQIVDGSCVYEIEQVAKEQPGTVPIMYICKVKN